MRPRAIVAEDEPLLAQQLATLLGRDDIGFEIVGIAANGYDALAMIERERPQVAFLDIRMPGLTGLDVAAQATEGLGADEIAPVIVFVSAFSEFAVRAFETTATDYLLKPVTEERLSKCVARVKQRLAAAPRVDVLIDQLRRLIPANAGAPPQGLRFLRAGMGGTVRMIPIDEVCYLHANGKYTMVFTRDGAALLRIPLKQLLPQLPPDQFVQIHRSTVVSLREVASAIRDDSGHTALTLRNRKETLAVSQPYADLFRQM